MLIDPVKDARYTLPDICDHPVSKSQPLIFGLSPMPYALNMIGLPSDPDWLGVNISRQSSPRLNLTVSPGFRETDSTLVVVCQAFASDNPLSESEPFVAST